MKRHLSIAVRRSRCARARRLRREEGRAVRPAGSRQSLTLMLDWVPNADHVGIYQALTEGDFTQAGLNVHVRSRPIPPRRSQLLAAGKVDAAISYEPEVMLARNRGLPLVSVAAIVQQPLTSIISLGSKHVRITGRRSCVARPSATPASLPARLPGHDPRPNAGVPLSKVKEINVGANLVPAMLSGRVDATLGGVLELRGDPARAARQASQRDPDGPGRRAELRRARAGCHAAARSRTNTDESATLRAGDGAGLQVGPARSPGSGRVTVRANPGSIQKLQRRASRRRCRRSSPARRQAVGLAGPGAVERLRPVDAQPPPDLEPERGRRRVDERAASRPGRVGSSAGVPRRPRSRAALNASRVASAMIVSCGLTPSALGTAEPSAT